MYKVPFLNFTTNSSNLELELQSIRSVLTSGQVILGQQVSAFEDQFARFCNARYCIGVANGLDAIEIGIRALGIGANDQVIVPAVSAYATLLGVIRAGATPVIADVECDTGHLCPKSVERCITAKTKAIMPVHLYGILSRPNYWKEFCSKNGILLIEDCAQAHGANSEHIFAGTFGSFGAYSFYPTKNLGASGDAGCIITNDSEIAKKAGMIRNYGQRDRYHHDLPGLNSRLDEIQAALLSLRLKQLETGNQRRREIAARYLQSLPESPFIKPIRNFTQSLSENVQHLFVVLSKNRDKLIQDLQNRGIQTIIHYPVPFHKQLAFKELQCDKEGLVGAEKFTDQCLSLPCHPGLSEVDITLVEQALEQIAKT
jgi:dTDP-4-amino-4,6-dideoxygalactose transaminase